MRSSTSSSDSGVDGGGPSGVRILWPRFWLLALIMLAIVIGAWEIFWRAQGFVPSLRDDRPLWALSRRAATESGEAAVVLVGSSRMQMDIHRETFALATGWEPAVQLAIVRGPSHPVLGHLAQDPEFAGTVLCEINPTLYFASTPGLVREIDEYLASYDSFSLADEVEQRLAMVVQGSLVTRLSRLRPLVIRNALRFQQMPRPRYMGPVGTDRFRYADYTQLANLALERERIERDRRAHTPESLGRAAFEARVDETAEQAARIRARGGRVIFVRMPSADEALAREERYWPRAEWWDVFASRVEAPSIHFLDSSLLDGFVPLDGDHLGKPQAIQYSERLGYLLSRMGLAPGPAPGKGWRSRDRS